MKHLNVLLLILLLAVVPLAAQRVDSTNTHFRVWAVDRVITDAQGRRMPAHAPGKLAFVAVYSPDFQVCAVEYVAARYADFDDLRKEKDKDKDKDDKDKTKVKVFEKAHTKKSDFEAAARASGFTNIDLQKSLIVRVP